MVLSLLLSTPVLASDRLDAPVEPVRQRVILEIDPGTPTFTGRTEITVAVPPGAPVDRFEVHGEGLVIESASMRQLRGKGRRFGAEVTPSSEDRLLVVPERRMRRGEYVLEVAYQGTLHDQAYGLYRFEHAGAAYVVSQLEADEARTAWPCFDEPSYKIPWQVSVRFPAGLEAISNTPIEQTVDDEGYRRVTFAWLPPTPSYALALAIGPYVATPVPDMPVPSQVWTTAGREVLAPSLAAELPSVTAWLSDWFGSPYPYAKLDFVAVPTFAFGAMENPGAVVIDESVLFTPERATPEGRAQLITVTAHEVAHMWFGDLVTMAWWDDFWLNEAFAGWMGENTTLALAPEFRGEVQRVARAASMIERDGSPTSRPIRTHVDPNAVFESVNFAVYAKGEALLDMLRAWIGPDAFRRGMAQYLGRHAWGNATAADLFAALTEASGKPVRDMFEAFADTPGAPAVHVADVGNGRVHISQTRWSAAGWTLEGGPWTVPLRLRVGRNDGTHEVVSVLLEGAEADVDLGHDLRWVHPAADGVGYYAWSLDDASMGALLEALPELSAPERRAVIASLELQVDSGRIDVGDLLGALSAFAEEEDPAIIEALIDAIHYVEVAEDLGDDALQARMNRWRRAWLRPYLSVVGLEPVPGEAPDVAALREQLLRVLADAEDPAVEAYGRRLGRAFLDEPTSVEPALASWALHVLALGGDRALQRTLFAKAAQTDDQQLNRTYLYNAGAVPGDAARDAALSVALSDGIADRKPLFALLFGVSSSRRDDADLDFALDWTFEHYDALAAKLSPPFRMRLARAGGGCSLERFERSRAFFADASREVPGTTRALAETEASVRSCIERRERYGARVRAYLEAWGG